MSAGSSQAKEHVRSAFVSSNAAYVILEGATSADPESVERSLRDLQQAKHHLLEAYMRLSQVGA